MSIKKILKVGLASALALGAGSAFAAAALSTTLVTGTNQFSDDNAETILKWDATLNGGAGGYRAFNFGVDTIAVKDILVGILHITSFPTAPGGASSALYNEMSGVYAVEVGTVAAETPTDCSGSGVLTSCSDFTFTAATIGFNSVFTTFNSVYGTTIKNDWANVDANTMASIVEDATADFDRGSAGGTTIDGAFDSATDGTQRLVLGLVAANGDYFNTEAPANPAQLQLLNAGAFGGNFGGEASVTYQNFFGWQFNDPMQIVGNLYKQVYGPFGIWSDSTYTIDVESVPEPGVAALLGLGLVLTAAARVARKGKSA